MKGFKVIKYILSFIAGAVFMRIFFWPEITETHHTEVKTELIVESVTVFDTVQIPLEILEYKIIEVKAPEETSEKFDSLRTYRGAERFAYGTINWQATTGGTLRALDFKPVFEIPITTFTNTVTNTRTIIEKPRGVYLAAGASTFAGPKFGASYLRDKYIFGYRYEPNTQSHYIEAGFKLF